MDEIKKSENEISKNEKIIALLPGSRDQEINKILQNVNVVKYFKEFKFIICAAPSQEKSKFNKYLKKFNQKILRSYLIKHIPF